MAEGGHRIFLKWANYTRAQKKLKIYASIHVANRVRRMLAKRRADRKRYHNRVLKRDFPRFLLRQKARAVLVLVKRSGCSWNGAAADEAADCAKHTTRPSPRRR